MRDPGPARPNPLFDRSAPDDEPAPGAADDVRGDEGGTGEDRGDGPGSRSDWARLDELLASPGSATEAILAAMLDAGPEAIEHLMNAGNELLLAAKAMLDAAERGLDEHRHAQAGSAQSGSDQAGSAQPAGSRDAHDEGVDLGGATPREGARVEVVPEDVPRSDVG